MEISLFFARIFGVYYLVMGVIWLVRPAGLREGFDAWRKNPGTVLLGGIVTLLIGAAIVASHQVYEASWRLVITLLGYAALLKGSLFTGWPHLLTRNYDRWTRGVLRWVVSLACIGLGCWFCWLGFGR